MIVLTRIGLTCGGNSIVAPRRSSYSTCAKIGNATLCQTDEHVESEYSQQHDTSMNTNIVERFAWDSPFSLHRGTTSSKSDLS